MVSQSGVQEAPVAAAAAVPVAHNPRSSRKRPERRGTPGLVGWSPRAHFAEGAGPWRWRGGRGPGDSQVLGEETSQAQHRVSGSRRERVTGRECFHVSRFSPDDDDPTPPPSWWNAPALTAERPRFTVSTLGSASNLLCDFGQVVLLLCAPVFSSVKWRPGTI